MVTVGDGANWVVDMLSRGITSGGWHRIGDLSSATAGWTPVSLTISSSAITDYLDSTSNDEILVRLYSSNASQVYCITMALSKYHTVMNFASQTSCLQFGSRPSLRCRSFGAS